MSQLDAAEPGEEEARYEVALCRGLASDKKGRRRSGQRTSGLLAEGACTVETVRAKKQQATLRCAYGFRRLASRFSDDNNSM